MLVIGLTGSIGMGKSTVAARLRVLGIGVCDADAEVHKLYEGTAVPPIEAAFPGTTENGKVDRQKLAAALLANPAGFKRLEAIVHPMVFEAERAFLEGNGVEVVNLHGLELPDGEAFAAVDPEEWYRIANEAARPEAQARAKRDARGVDLVPVDVGRGIVAERGGQLAVRH